MNMTPGVMGVVLAAGASRRLGQPKQLVIYRGRSLVRIAAEAVLTSDCAQVVVVVGAQGKAVRNALDGLSAEVVVNGEWKEGIASSIRCGVALAQRRGCGALMLVVCDQPSLTATHLGRLIGAHREGAKIVASRYGGVSGVPAVFDATYFPSLTHLRGDVGARGILRTDAVMNIDWSEGAQDLDTADDLTRLRGSA